MDFMKVLDHAVRKIKREVNLKVLKIPEIEQKVLDATDDEPWGPHGTVLAEIAQATKQFIEYHMVMNVLWVRLGETGKNWRSVYKALTVVDYLVANGSERALDDIIEHTFQISSLMTFEYVEPNGKDVGLNVRKKAETLVGLLNNTDKIQEVRDKAAANREKYFGLSSSGITYKSGAASFSGSNFRSSDQYGGFGNSETAYDSYKDKARDEKTYEKKTKSKKEPSYHNSKKQDSPATDATVKSTKNCQLNKHDSASSKADLSDKYDEDFDPRGTSSSKPCAGSNHQVDLFGQNFVDLLDAPTVAVHKDPQAVDLFADADFVSAITPEPESVKSPVPQANIDLFSNHPSPAVPCTVDFFSAVTQFDNGPSEPDTSTNSVAVDPYAPVLNTDLDRSDREGTTTFQKDSQSTVSDSNPPNDESRENMKESLAEIKSPPKQAFHVKSGIWADSLTRGLIDLNITARKYAPPLDAVSTDEVGVRNAKSQRILKLRS